jgi:hypothetical protein
MALSFLYLAFVKVLELLRLQRSDLPIWQSRSLSFAMKCRSSAARSCVLPSGRPIGPCSPG